MQNEILRGVVRRVFFANPDSPWMAGVLQTDVGDEARFSGKLVAQPGDRIELSGSWTRHPKFGMQFEADSGLVKMDESPEALVHLLSTDSRFSGLGPARARKLVEAALALSADGELASALADYTDEIVSRSGVPREHVENARDIWHSKRDYFDSLAQLVDQGWTNGQAQAIQSKLGDNAATIVAADPYLLIGKIPRFGFRTVDTVALKMGIKPTDSMRLKSGVAYCLDQMGGNGSTWTTRESLIQEAVDELRPDTLEAEDLIREALDELIRSGVVYTDWSPVEDTEMVADARMAAAEFEVFAWLRQGLQQYVPEMKLDGPRAQRVVPTLNEGQRAALDGFANFRVGVMSGGAGVGKTYTLRAVCEVAEENGLFVALCAPTGKAARRLQDATGREASTIHRLLEPYFDEQTGEFGFSRNAGNPIEADLVVIDEVSMVDVRLMRSLLKAMQDGDRPTRLLLVGDHHQIPSVSPGAILRDVLGAQAKHDQAIHILTNVVRQAGILARNTQAVLDGVVVKDSVPAWKVVTTEKGLEDSAAALIAAEVESLVTRPEAFEPFSRPLDLALDVQVLTPMRKGPLGTWALNTHLQKLRQRLLGNQPPPPVKEGERPKPCVGDRVIWTKNDYVLEIFNGTQAVVIGFKKGGAVDLFLDDGREVTIPPEKRSNMELAFAMTIHKAQGSEWPCVLLVASSAHWIMHDRNLLYTGASRASEGLILFGDNVGMRHFATERRSARRQTFGSFLMHGWEPRSWAAQPAAAALDETLSREEG